MARPANVQAFIHKHQRQFEQVYLATKIPPSVIVAQSALETGWGSSTLYQQGRSLFAFRYYPRHEFYVQLSGGKYAGYSSYDEAAEDYIWLMTKAESSGMADFREWAGYKAVLRAAAALYEGTDDRDATTRRALAVCEALGASKFCEGGGYNNESHGVGGKLKQIVLAYDLVALDPPIRIEPYIPAYPGQPGGPAEAHPGESYWSLIRGNWVEFWQGVGQGLKKAAQAAASPLRGILLALLAFGALRAILEGYQRRQEAAGKGQAGQI